MGHIHFEKEDVYRALAERLAKNPVGVIINETLMQILHRLYTESEAMVGSKFPVYPMTLDKIAGITEIGEDELKNILDNMAKKGLLLDLPRKNGVIYMLTPMVIGFFEYTFMRVRDDIDMKEMAGLFENYFSNEGVIEEISGDQTKFFRTVVYEKLIPLAVQTEVLDYEKASEIIRNSGGGALSTCSCRHKATHLGKACNAPLDVCTSLGNTAQWLVNRGFAKPATTNELLSILEVTEKAGLVHLCDNVLNRPAYICHCCGCCCLVLRSAKESGKLITHPSNFIPEYDNKNCNGCGVCAEACHIDAIAMQDDGSGEGEEMPIINKDSCIGCGVCVSACPNSCLIMSRRQVLYVPPENKMQQFAMIAREKGRV